MFSKAHTRKVSTVRINTAVFKILSSGLLEMLNDMNSKLDVIQRSLDMYLETKRQHFPRFYFISNDDLLEILGQSKNPIAVSERRELGTAMTRLLL